MKNNSCFVWAVVLGMVIAGCAAQPTAPPSVSRMQPNSIAVWDLENLSPVNPELADLGDMLSASIMDAVRQTDGYTLVERQQLNLALRELNLGSSALADETTRLRIGKIVGARLMIFGAYQVITDQMRLDLRLIEVETGRVLKAAEKTTAGTDPAGWLSAAQTAASELLKSLGQ